MHEPPLTDPQGVDAAPEHQPGPEGAGGPKPGAAEPDGTVPGGLLSAGEARHDGPGQELQAGEG